MKAAMKIYFLGQLLMVLGSVAYIVELFTMESPTMTLVVTIIYLVALLLTFIGWLGTGKERKAENQRQKQEEAARKAAKQAASRAA